MTSPGRKKKKKKYTPMQCAEQTLHRLAPRCYVVRMNGRTDGRWQHSVRKEAHDAKQRLPPGENTIYTIYYCIVQQQLCYCIVQQQPIYERMMMSGAAERNEWQWPSRLMAAQTVISTPNQTNPNQASPIDVQAKSRWQPQLNRVAGRTGRSPTRTDKTRQPEPTASEHLYGYCSIRTEMAVDPTMQSG